MKAVFDLAFRAKIENAECFPQGKGEAPSKTSLPSCAAQALFDFRFLPAFDLAVAGASNGH
jgi:hypothetical protein